MLKLMAAMESHGGNEPPPHPPPPLPWRDPKIHPLLPEYDMQLTSFTASVHHSGEWIVSNGRRAYVGGEVACFDYCDTDKFSIGELRRLVDLLGKEENPGFLFVPFGFEFDEGMKFRTDMHTRMMIKDMETRGYKDCHFYVVEVILGRPSSEDNQDEDGNYYEDEDEPDYSFEDDGEEPNGEEVPEEEVLVNHGFAKWWSRVVSELENDEELEEDDLSDNTLENLEVDSDGEVKVRKRCQFKMREGINWEESNIEVDIEFINKQELNRFEGNIHCQGPGFQGDDNPQRKVPSYLRRQRMQMEMLCSRRFARRRDF